MGTILDPDVRTFFPSGDYEEPGTTLLGMVEVVMTRLSWTIPTCQQEPTPRLRKFQSALVQFMKTDKRTQMAKVHVEEAPVSSKPGIHQRNRRQVACAGIPN